jgi:hypothetical protein
MKSRVARVCPDGDRGVFYFANFLQISQMGTEVIFETNPLKQAPASFAFSLLALPGSMIRFAVSEKDFRQLNRTIGGEMKLVRGVMPICAFILAATYAFAQQPDQPNLAWIEYQRPKPGMSKQFEEGRKQKASWHRERGDTVPLYVWETLMGEGTGTYLVGLLNQTWAGLDRPAAEESAESDEFARAIGPTVERVVSRLFSARLDLSRPPADPAPSAYAALLSFKVRYGRMAEFNSLVQMYYEATGKAENVQPFIWYDLVYGGEGGTVVLSLPRNSWQDLAPTARSTRALLEETLGSAKADLFTRTLAEVVESQSSELIRFRPDLSYIPAP